MLCLKHQKTYILLFHFEWISNEYPISRPKLIKIRVKYLRRDSYKMPLQFWPRSLMRSSSLGEMCPNTKLILVRNFPVFALNTEIYKVNLRSQSEYRKIRTRNNSVFRHFSSSASDVFLFKFPLTYIAIKAVLVGLFKLVFH